jgi:hypothetical protein
MKIDTILETRTLDKVLSSYILTYTNNTDYLITIQNWRK